MQKWFKMPCKNGLGCSAKIVWIAMHEWCKRPCKNDIKMPDKNDLKCPARIT